MKLICVDKDILGGTPVFEGTRVPIKNLFDYLEEGHSIDVFLDEFPTVNRKQVIQVIELSQKILQQYTSIINENFVR